MIFPYTVWRLWSIIFGYHAFELYAGGKYYTYEMTRKTSPFKYVGWGYDIEKWDGFYIEGVECE
jgi:hypothetical protein